jgi:hypothetical protein
MQPDGLDHANLYDVSLPYLPDREEVDRLDALLADMLAKSQAELDRLAPRGGPGVLVSP